jgi:hypothetical protein
MIDVISSEVLKDDVDVAELFMFSTEVNGRLALQVGEERNMEGDFGAVLFILVGSFE